TILKLKRLTCDLGDDIWKFILETCSQFNTKELLQEYQAHTHQAAKKVSAMGNNQKASSLGKQKVTLNINTYKFHALGNIIQSIKMFGTTDNYMSQGVSFSPLYGHHKLYSGMQK
ncbi:hypothetical protein FA15DRAFT_599043, partial [Coprinopsis marcescibilis]